VRARHGSTKKRVPTAAEIVPLSSDEQAGIPSFVLMMFFDTALG
jgi:hypothetical protein